MILQTMDIISPHKLAPLDHEAKRQTSNNKKHFRPKAEFVWDDRPLLDP
jgi:hypothetical protein